MMTPERLYVRVDATPETGLGHFTRCLALAQHWRDTLGTATFVGRYGRTESEALDAEGIAIRALTASHPLPSDLDETETSIPRPAAVVLDGYDFDYEYQAALGRGRRLLVVDDFGHQDAYAGSGLMNPNFGAETVAYASAPAERLLGPRFALLRREFRSASAPHSAVPREQGPVERVLVSCGGSDVRNDTVRLVRLLIDASPQLSAIRVVVGSLNPHRAGLEALASEHPAVALRIDPRNMRAEMEWCDFAIATAGSIAFELAALGIPALLFAVADNQCPGGRSIGAAGVARFGGDLRELGDEQILNEIGDALADSDRNASMRRIGPGIVDGDGVARVCRYLRGGRR